MITVHHGGHSDSNVISLAAMWLVMMIVMMAPVVWPWVRAFHRFDLSGRRADGSSLATAEFIGGYIVAWSGYALVAAAVQIGLQKLQMFDVVGDRLGPWPAATVLAAAGLYQLAPLKRACLTHCRNPMTYFLTRWRPGPAGGLRIGLAHGAYCVGCCWALMATAFAVGVMNTWWMAFLTAAAFIEQVSPWGARLRVPLAIAMGAAAAARLLA
jgi:predicted metal-binding membrane protein